MSGHVARVVCEFWLDDEQLARAQARARELDLGNMGEADEHYSPSLAMARIVASDDVVVPTLIPAYTEGYTAEPEG